MKKIRKKKGPPQKTVEERIEELKEEHGFEGVRLFPSPDDQAHVGPNMEDQCVDIWIPWGAYREATAAQAKMMSPPVGMEEGNGDTAGIDGEAGENTGCEASPGDESAPDDQEPGDIAGGDEGSDDVS